MIALLALPPLTAGSSGLEIGVRRRHLAHLLREQADKQMKCHPRGVDYHSPLLEPALAIGSSLRLGASAKTGSQTQVRKYLMLQLSIILSSARNVEGCQCYRCVCVCVVFAAVLIHSNTH